MSWTLITDPLIEPLWLLSLSFMALAAMAFSTWVRAPGTPYRALVLTTLLALLLNPTLRKEEREPVTDIVVIVVDQSASMDLADRADTRDQALDTLKQALDLLPALDVRIVNSDERGRDGGTALFTTLDRAIADIPRDRLAGIMLLSDGQVHDAPESLASLAINAPLHAMLIGNPKATDRKIIIEEAPRFGIVNETVSIRFRVEEEGVPTTPIAIRVEHDGKFLRQLSVDPGDTTTVTFSVPHGGENIVELIAETRPNELTEQNNRAMLIVTGIRDRLRVLLVSGEPHAGERTWRNLLKADPSVDLVHFTILRPPEKQDGTPISELSLIAFPTRELFSVKLNEFDLVIFDRYRRRGVLPIIYLNNVARYVEEGGAVLAAAGPAFASPFSIYRTPLAGILPAQPTGKIIEQGFRAGITDEGRRHPVTAGLPGSETTPPKWGRWFRLIETTATSGTTVMHGPDSRPLMVLDRVGDGRVAQLLSDHAWLWTRGYDGGGPQAELLRRLAHWLMKEPDLEEERLLASGEDGTLRIERHTMADTTNLITVTSPSGSQEDLILVETTTGRFTGQLDTSEQGIYQISDGDLRAVAAMGPANPREFRDVSATAKTLAPLVAETGGGVFWLNQMGNTPSLRAVRPGRDAAGKNWAGLRQNARYVLKAVSQVPLFSPLISLFLLIGLLLLGWRREAR